jgi:hypothetical protein
MLTQLDLNLANIGIYQLLSPGKLPGASILSGFSWPTWTHRYNTRTGGNDIKLLIFVVEADKKWAGVLVPGKFFRQILYLSIMSFPKVGHSVVPICRIMIKNLSVKNTLAFFCSCYDDEENFTAFDTWCQSCKTFFLHCR